MLLGFLAPLGLAVDEVGEGAAVLPAVQRLRPQLVLLDLNLPDASGWDLCRLLRARGTSTAGRDRLRQCAREHRGSACHARLFPLSSASRCARRN
ncbi:response regulator [Cupriavidus basilensis]